MNKTPEQIYHQWTRIYQKINSNARLFAAKAHPETGGNGLCVHNWGNQAAKDVLKRADARVTRIRRRYEAMYDLAEHRRHTKQGWHPSWCDHCLKP